MSLLRVGGRDSEGKTGKKWPGMVLSDFKRIPAHAREKGISTSDTGEIDIYQPAHRLLGNVVPRENNISMLFDLLKIWVWEVKGLNG